MKKRILSVLVLAVMCIACLAGCTNGGKESGGVTEVTWYYPGVKTEGVHDVVHDAANKLLEERYGLKIKFVMIDSGNFAQKLQMMNASQESYDLVFTSNWQNDYYTNVINGALLPLEDLLPKYAPTLYKSLSEAEITAATIDGHLYGVPNWQIQARSMGFIFPKEKLDKVGMTIDDFANMEDFEEYLGKITAVEPETNKMKEGWQVYMTNHQMVTVVKEGLPGVIYANKEGKPEIINQFETEEFMNFAKMRSDWYKKGYLPPASDTGKDFKKAEFKQCPGDIVNWKPGLASEYEATYGYEWVSKQISPAVSSTEVLLSTLTGISANTENAEEAVKILEIMNTDKEIYNMLCFGIEGENYTKVSDNVIKVKEGNKYSMSNWRLGSVANSYILEGNDENQWKDTKVFNDNSVKSPLLGFALDSSKINAELGNCQTVIKEYIGNINAGVEDPDVIVPELISGLKEAGVDDLLAEIQRQIDEWWENK